MAFVPRPSPGETPLTTLPDPLAVRLAHRLLESNGCTGRKANSDVGSFPSLTLTTHSHQRRQHRRRTVHPAQTRFIAPRSLVCFHGPCSTSPIHRTLFHGRSSSGGAALRLSIRSCPSSGPQVGSSRPCSQDRGLKTVVSRPCHCDAVPGRWSRLHGLGSRQRFMVTGPWSSPWLGAPQGVHRLV